jgi:hypothetical protein
VEFSLKQGWIQIESAKKTSPFDPQQIEQEIQGIRDVIQLYGQMAEPTPSQKLNQQLQALVQNQQGIIFTPKV